MSDHPNRMSVITDWRVQDEDALPDVPPGGEYERVVTPQKFVVLCRILVRGRGMSLVRLQIGAVDVPFELVSVDVHDGNPVRRYRPKGLDDEALRKRLIAPGATVATADSIAVVPGIDIRAHLRNESEEPAKPRVALLVQEEIS